MFRTVRLLLAIATGAVLLMAGITGCSGGGSNTPTAPTTPTSTRIISLTGSMVFGSVTVNQRLDRTLTVVDSPYYVGLP